LDNLRHADLFVPASFLLLLLLLLLLLFLLAGAGDRSGMGMDRNTTGADANADAAAQQQPDQQLRHLEQALRQRDETIGVLQVSSLKSAFYMIARIIQQMRQLACCRYLVYKLHSTRFTPFRDSRGGRCETARIVQQMRLLACCRYLV
jgi:hypothetical protein